MGTLSPAPVRLGRGGFLSQAAPRAPRGFSGLFYIARPQASFNGGQGFNPPLLFICRLWVTKVATTKSILFLRHEFSYSLYRFNIKKAQRAICAVAKYRVVGGLGRGEAGGYPREWREKVFFGGAGGFFRFFHPMCAIHSKKVKLFRSFTYITHLIYVKNKHFFFYEGLASPLFPQRYAKCSA